LTISLYIIIYNGNLTSTHSSILFIMKKFIQNKFIAKVFTFLYLTTFTYPVSPVAADQINAAVATNFYNPFMNIVKQFEIYSGHEVNIISGSTGKLYAQIMNGAPFDIFLSADSLRPKFLIQNGKAISGTQFTYAFGKIILWSPDSNLILNNLKLTFLKQTFSHLAIANPITAPYGKAAYQVLKKIGQWDKLKSVIVRGENIGQTYHFIFSQNAELGFVSLSQVLDPQQKTKGKYLDIPIEYYDPIKQDVVVLSKGEKNSGALDLWQFLKSPQAKRIIKEYGYGLQ